MTNLIKINGYTIDATKVAMIDRRQATRTGEYSGKKFVESGVWLYFTAGGRRWIDDPEAKAVEAAFAEYDGVQNAELPY